jgi:hypothetical protein
MAATTLAVIGTVASVGSAVENRNARRSAARGQEQARIEGVELLTEAGRQGEQDLLEAETGARDRAAQGGTAAIEQIQPFAAGAAGQFAGAKNQILSNTGNAGIQGSIRDASLSAADPNIFDLSGPVGQESVRQADISASGAMPHFNQSALTSSLQGLAATGDIAGINQRDLNLQSQIVGAGAAGRASALIGSVPQLADLSAGATEARLLGSVAGQQGNSNIAEQLARLAGRVT